MNVLTFHVYKTRKKTSRDKIIDSRIILMVELTTLLFNFTGKNPLLRILMHSYHLILETITLLLNFLPWLANKKRNIQNIQQNTKWLTTWNTRKSSWKKDCLWHFQKKLSMWKPENRVITKKNADIRLYSKFQITLL